MKARARTRRSKCCRRPLPWRRLQHEPTDPMTHYDLATPALVIDADGVRRNLRRMREYVAAHGLKLRPHTKTHKSVVLGRMQLEEGGASGLTVAKAGEAEVMSDASDDLLVAYPTVDARRCAALA